MLIEKPKNIIPGEPYSRAIPLFQKNEAGEERPVDFTQIKEVKIDLRRGSRDSRLVASLSLSRGSITIQDGNVVVFEFPASFTQNLRGWFNYELQLTYHSGKVETWLRTILDYPKYYTHEAS